LMLSFLPFPALFSLNPKWPFKEDALTEMSQESKWQGSVSSEIFPAFTKAWRHDRNLDFLGWISQKGTLSTLHSSTTKGQVDCLWWAEKQKQEKAATNLSLEVLGLILITAVAFSTSTALIVHVACSHFLPFQMGALMPLFYRGLLATSLHPWIYHISLQITFFFFYRVAPTSASWVTGYHGAKFCKSLLFQFKQRTFWEASVASQVPPYTWWGSGCLFLLFCFFW
jgi:hypothetical protein